MKTTISIGLVMLITLLFNGLVADNNSETVEKTETRLNLFKEKVVRYESIKPNKLLLYDLNRLKSNIKKTDKEVKELEEVKSLNDLQIDTIITTPKKNGFFKRIVTSIKRNN